MKTFAKETLSTSPVRLLGNLLYIHISWSGMTLRCTQAMIQCCFGAEKPQLEERLCTPVWQTTLWQQQMPQKLSLLMVTTVELLLLSSYNFAPIICVNHKCLHLFNPTNDQGQISPHNIEKNKLFGKDFKNL